MDGSVAYVQKYQDGFLRIAQQKRSRVWKRLMGGRSPDSIAYEQEVVSAAGFAMGETRMRGKFAYFDHIGKAVMEPYVGRSPDTPAANTPLTRRRVTTRMFHRNELIDPNDVIRMGKDPTAAIATESMSAAGRTLDELAIGYDDGSGTLRGGLLGVAYDVDENESATSVALPSAQIIDSDSVGLVFTKLIEAKTRLLAAEAINEDGDDAKLYLFHTARALSDILNHTQPTSSDFVSIKALIKGEITEFMGFEWVRYESLPVVNTTERRLVTCTEKALGEYVGESPFCRIGERSDKSYSNQVYCRFDAGAVRTEEVQVVAIDVTEDGVLS